MASHVQDLSLDRISEDGTLVARSEFSLDAFVIALYGDLDIASAPELETLLTTAEATSASEIVVDLSGLKFIDSTGIRLLALADARSRQDGNRLSLLRGPAAVQRAFTLCGLDAHLPFAD